MVTNGLGGVKTNMKYLHILPLHMIEFPEFLQYELPV
jgi:hypothetical protein